MFSMIIIRITLKVYITLKIIEMFAMLILSLNEHNISLEIQSSLGIHRESFSRTFADIKICGCRSHKLGGPTVFRLLLTFFIAIL